MVSAAYRYEFLGSAPIEEVEATFVLSIFAVESMCGEAQTRLDAAHALDAQKRTIVIDAATEVGRALNRVFTGLITREFGAGSFRVERVPSAQQPKPRPEPVTA
jgi:hypothetical protein